MAVKTCSGNGVIDVGAPFLTIFQLPQREPGPQLQREFFEKSRAKLRFEP